MTEVCALTAVLLCWFPCYTSEWRSALSLQIPLTSCALFFRVLLKLEEFSPKFTYFLEYTVFFYIFAKVD